MRLAILVALLASGPSAADPVLRDLCGKRVALLGESPLHGFGKTLEYKAGLVRSLIDQCHYNAFFIESGIYDFLNIESRLKAGQDVTEPMLAAAIGGLWATREVQPLIPFLLERAKAGRLTLGGLDDQLGRGTWAQREMPAALMRGRCLAIFQKHMLWQYTAAAPYSPQDKTLMLGCLDQLGSNAMVDNLRRLLDRDFQPSDASARDRSMYLNFEWWIRRLPPRRKVIVWAATTHLAKQGTEAVPLGSYLHREFGSRAFVLGFSAYSGSYAMTGQRPHTLPAAPANSLEAVAFAGRQSDSAYLSPRTLRKCGPVPARQGASFKTARWDEIVDSLLIFREERPPEFLPR